MINETELSRLSELYDQIAYLGEPGLSNVYRDSMNNYRRAKGEAKAQYAYKLGRWAERATRRLQREE